MNPEQRFIKVHKDFLVKCLVVLIGAVLWCFEPQRMDVIDRQRFYNAFLFSAVFVFLDIAVLIINRTFLVMRIEVDFIWHELAVFVQDLADSAFLQKFLFFFGDVHDDGGSVFGAGTILNLIAVFPCRNPMYRFCSFFVGQGLDLYSIRYHERRIKSQTKMSDDSGALFALFFIFFQKFGCTGEGNLCNIFFHFICRHTKTIIYKL